MRARDAKFPVHIVIITAAAATVTTTQTKPS